MEGEAPVTCGILPNLFHASIYPNFMSTRQRWRAWFKTKHSHFELNPRLFCFVLESINNLLHGYQHEKAGRSFSSQFNSSVSQLPLCSRSRSPELYGSHCIAIGGGTWDNQWHKRIVCLCVSVSGRFMMTLSHLNLLWWCQMCDGSIEHTFIGHLWVLDIWCYCKSWIISD